MPLAATTTIGGGVEAAAFAALDEFAPEGPLGIAVSGGGDSVALLHFTRRWAEARGRRIAAATVDHRLRAESAAEAEGVARRCAALGVPHETLVWTAWDGGGNLQAAARAARRELLAGWAGREGLSAVALGHTLDDQAETILMRLARGSGVDGLSGMAPRAVAEGATWLRPLLGLRRTTLRDWLRACGEDWFDDPSNDDLRFDRVKARRALAALSELGLDAEGLAATAHRLQDARAALDHGAAELAARAAVWGGCGELRLALDPLRRAPHELARRMLRASLKAVSGAEHGPRADAEASLATAIFGLRLGGGRSLHGCVVRPDGPFHVVITRETAAIDPAPVAPAPGGVIWDRRFHVTPTAPTDGAMIAPLGEAGATRLKSLEESGAWRPAAAWKAAPRAARIATPALWRGEALAAAPVAGYGDALAARFIGVDFAPAGPDLG